MILWWAESSLSLSLYLSVFFLVGITSARKEEEQRQKNQMLIGSREWAMPNLNS